jgi:hypothetical protein
LSSSSKHVSAFANPYPRVNRVFLRGMELHWTGHAAATEWRRCQRRIRWTYLDDCEESITFECIRCILPPNCRSERQFPFDYGSSGHKDQFQQEEDCYFRQRKWHCLCSWSYLSFVQYVPRKGSNKKIKTTKACKEIILAAGAPHSPQILQLSGIGPEKLLSSLGIKTLVNLPGVGQNFQDQPAMFISYTCQSSHPLQKGCDKMI